VDSRRAAVAAKPHRAEWELGAGRGRLGAIGALLVLILAVRIVSRSCPISFSRRMIHLATFLLIGPSLPFTNVSQLVEYLVALIVSALRLTIPARHNSLARGTRSRRTNDERWLLLWPLPGEPWP